MERYKELLEQLVKYGKFNILKDTVKGLNNLDPNNPARRAIFKESGNKEERVKLKERLKEWHQLMSEKDTIEEAINTAQEEVEKSEKLLNDNLKTALEETKELEITYSSIASFFKNARVDEITNLTILNASKEQLTNPRFDQFRKAVKEQLVWAYGTLGKADNYSFIVIPEFLGSNAMIREWSQMARDNKVMLVNSFYDLHSHKDVIEIFDREPLTDLERTNMMLVCNWIVGRPAYVEVGENEALFIPPAAALAGKLYDPSVPISQPRAGKRFGTLEGVEGVRFKLLQENIGQLDQRGLVPITSDFKGTIMAYSARTLSNADDVGLQTYSVVQVFDWVGKVIIDFLNRAGFENATQHMLDTYRAQIAKFLNSISGHNKLIKEFKINKFEIDPSKKDRILVHIVMEPNFPARSFALKMDGTSGEGIDNYIWNTQLGD